MEYESVIVGALETNCYLVYCPSTLECAVIDPGADAEKIFHVIAKRNLKPVLILNTHGHIDHIGANKDIKDRFNIPICIHPGDSFMLEKVSDLELSFFLQAKSSPPADYFLKDGQIIKLGTTSLKVIHTPGHSEGSVSFLGDKVLFSGDTLFSGGVGRTDLPGGSWRDLENSIQTKILTLPDETVVLPGHGPFTTVGIEKNSNPFVS